MFWFNGLLVDIIFCPKRGKVKWSQWSHYLKKGNAVEKTFFYCKKKYLRLLCVCEGWLWPLGEEVEDHCRMKWQFILWSLLAELDLMCTVMGDGPRDVREISVGCRCAEQLFWMCCWILVQTSPACSESQKYYQFFFFLFLFAKLSWTFG